MSEWTVSEVSGAEVRSVVDGKLGEVVKELEPGMEVACFNLFGYEPATVRSDGYGELYAESEHYLYNLQRADDERDCWVTYGAVNKKCINVG